MPAVMKLQDACDILLFGLSLPDIAAWGYAAPCMRDVVTDTVLSALRVVNSEAVAWLSSIFKIMIIFFWSLLAI